MTELEYKGEDPRTMADEGTAEEINDRAAVEIVEETK